MNGLLLDVFISRDCGLSQVQLHIVSFGKSIADLEAFKQLVSCSRYVTSIDKSLSFLRDRSGLPSCIIAESRASEMLLSALHAAIVDR